ncbi:MAG TPA: hypothetical protein VFI47_19365, partial [Acidimicrobiales bacterium]|nr:hypothetical protein [Acidimicrobiales bacterium]
MLSLTIKPLRVVHHHHHRAVLGLPVQKLEGSERDHECVRRPALVHPKRGQQGITLWPGQFPRLLEQRADHLMQTSKRHTRLGPNPRHRQDPHTLTHRPINRRRQQRRLTDTRATPNHQPRTALSHPTQPPDQDTQLALPAHQPTSRAQ